MVSDTAFTFHMCTPFGKTFPLAARSRSSVNVKVKYRDHISFLKIGPFGCRSVSEPIVFKLEFSLENQATVRSQAFSTLCHALLFICNGFQLGKG